MKRNGVRFKNRVKLSNFLAAEAPLSTSTPQMKGWRKDTEMRSGE